ELMKEHFTKFKPGVDEWQFVNYGSYAAPKGHCAGQSTGMLWYYSQKKNKGSPQLFGRFDNDGMRKTPNVWQDDVQGYKFCSMMQNDWDNSLSTLLFRSWQGKDDIRALRAFSYALRLTNQPQYVDIWTSNWKEGHALVVYGISRGTLYVADPNYPGITDRVIHFDEFNRIYMPYFTGLKTGDPGIQFTIIQYAAKTALSNWTTASERWKSIADGTIGNGSFPNFTIVALNDKSEFVPLSDGFQVEQGGRLTLNVRGEGFTPDFEVFNDHEDQLKKDGSSVFLPSGKNLIGIYVKEIKDKKVNWVGFKWFTVNVPGETMPGPASGALKLNLWIDGVKAEVDTATFRVTGSSQIYYFLDINATINNQGKPYKTYARIAVGLWRGGTYSGGLSPLTNWSSYASGSDIYYAPDDKDLGHIAINAWSYKKLEGTFNAKGYSEDKKLSTTIDGDFHFLE
ncbi:MAG: hypothetical protein JNJ85_16665, partial [Candidatus Kapabacteria bacterium]|nr:hypothetical protein [Candidatus Kapabacteria bacterium]